MATSGSRKEADKRCLEDVLKTYCSDTINQTYTALDHDAKSKLLLALRSLLEMIQQQSLMDELRVRLGAKSSCPVGIDQDPVLTKALRSVALTKTILKDYSSLKQRLKSWGMPKPYLQTMLEHQQCISRIKQTKAMKAKNDCVMQWTSQNATKDTPNVDFPGLKKTFIRDLKLFQTAADKFLEGRIIIPPSIMTGLYTFLQDDNGDYVQLALYNVVTSGPMQWEIADSIFSVGTKLKISQPFYKIFADGTTGVRVDNPSEIFVEIPNNHLTVDEIRSRGKALIENGRYFEALDLYLEGLKKTKIEALLNNRAQTEIKLEQYEEALLDAASVLLFSNNTKANQRYTMAAQKLGFDKDDKRSIYSIWKHVLQHQRKDECLPGAGTKERGNEAFKQGNYEEAKKNYSSALKDSEACILLNNIAIVCLKLELFHTAISAASACLQMSMQGQVRGKAHYSMAKALALLGEKNLSKLSMDCDPSIDTFWRKESEKMWDFILAPTGNEAPGPNCQKLETWGFVKTDAIEHVYIEGRGRGIRAKRDIGTKELLMVDHQISIQGVKFIESREITFSLSTTGGMDKKSHLELVTKILTLVKYDGLLGKKIQSLESRGKLDTKTLPLADLEWMVYRKFSYDVPPFLPQTPEVVGCDSTILTEPFIDKVVRINCFGDTMPVSSQLEGGSYLALSISLLNHDDNPNCVVIGFKDAFALETKRKIKNGEEVTISYGNNTEKWGF